MSALAVAEPTEALPAGPTAVCTPVPGGARGELDVFRSHFHRDCDPANPHDAACLSQIRLFAERFGRLPDTQAKGDLELLQKIELGAMPAAAPLAPQVVDPVYDAIHGPAGLRLDQLEAEMMKHPAPVRPLVHRFTPGLYIRELTTPAGTISVSKVHKSEHPFTISKGRVAMWDVDGEGCTVYAAPYTGITKPGTRRVSYFLEDTVWTTYHPTNLTDLAEIEAEIIEKHDEHLAGLVQPTALPTLEGAAP